MDEGKRTKRNIWNDDDDEEVKRAKKRSRLKSVLSFFLVLLAVLAVVVLAAYRDGTGFDVLRRYLHYGKAEETGGEVLYDYDASVSNRFAVLDKHLVVLSETRLRVLSQNGEEVWSTAVNMSDPALEVGGGLAVAYDVGGSQLFVVDKEGAVQKLTAAEGEPFIAASLNEEGWLAVVSAGKYDKSNVNVYDPDMEQVFTFYASRRFVADACVVGDGSALAAATLGQENSVLVTNVVLYDLKETDPVADYDVSDGLVAAIRQQGERIVAVTDTCISFAETDGSIAGTYSYGGAYLREYDLAGEDFAALLLNRYQSGSVGRLVTLDTAGQELGALDLNEEVLDISAAGRYLAVLYASRVVVYNQNLQVYASLNGTEQTRGILMRPDGSVLLLSSESAGLFLP